MSCSSLLAKVRLVGTEVQLRGRHCYKCDDSDSSDSDNSDDSDNSNDRSSEKNGPAHRTI